jgi:uncharacterized protein
MKINVRRSIAALALLATCILAPATAWAQAPTELVRAARSQIGVTVRYDPRYERIAYPNGDVPLERGVCTDVVIRAYRTLGFDLQALVHQDMGKAWHVYPKLWQLKAPDRNIDHRRVPNLATYFKRHGTALPASRDGRNYQPGDIVTWRLANGRPHIGIVADKKGWTGAPLVIHNIGAGTKEENVLFSYEITGHYRWQPVRQ